VRGEGARKARGRHRDRDQSSSVTRGARSRGGTPPSRRHRRRRPKDDEKPRKEVVAGRDTVGEPTTSRITARRQDARSACEVSPGPPHRPPRHEPQHAAAGETIELLYRAGKEANAERERVARPSCLGRRGADVASSARASTSPGSASRPRESPCRVPLSESRYDPDRPRAAGGRRRVREAQEARPPDRGRSARAQNRAPVSAATIASRRSRRSVVRTGASPRSSASRGRRDQTIRGTQPQAAVGKPVKRRLKQQQRRGPCNSSHEGLPHVDRRQGASDIAAVF
jgi:hypothetical protein